MVANIRGYTPNYNFKLINFDTPRWHTHEYSNWNMLDAMFLQAGVPGIRGAWENNTHYLAGERVFDGDTSDMYRCLVEHTSNPTGTFTQDRTMAPTRWALQTLGVPLYRGPWASGVKYSLGDIVNVDDYTYYLCIVQHTSGITFTGDILFWQLVFDGKPLADLATQAVEDAQEDADTASTKADEAEDSADRAKSSEDAATARASDAAQSATNAATSETHAATSETNAAASAVAAADQAAALRGTSLTSNTVSTGSKTFTTQASKQFNVGNYVTIVATANPTGQVITGAITAYSGTTLTTNITGFLGAGTVADWQIYVSGMQGQKGADGSGGGGITDANADGKIYGRLNNAWVETVQKSGDSMAGHLGLPAGPADNQAVRKDYVDTAVSGLNITSYAPLASPIFTGDPKAPTPSAGDNDTSIATSAFVKVAVDTAIAALPAPPVAATSPEYIANSAPTKMLTSGAVWTAAQYTTLTDAATVVINLSLGLDFLWTLGALGRTLANPTLGKPGQKGLIFILGGGATGSITSWGSAWKFPGGVKPVMGSAGPNIISYVVGGDGTTMFCTFASDFG